MLFESRELTCLSDRCILYPESHVHGYVLNKHPLNEWIKSGHGDEI